MRKNNKKIMSFILIICMSFTLISCGSSERVGGLGNISLDDSSTGDSIGTLGGGSKSDSDTDTTTPSDTDDSTTDPVVDPTPSDDNTTTPDPVDDTSTDSNVLTLVPYECDAFTATIPSGWEVIYDVVKVEGSNRIYIFIRDTSNPKNMFFFIQTLEPYFGSQDAKDAWIYILPSATYLPDTAVLTEISAKGTLDTWTQSYKVMESEGIISPYLSSYSPSEILTSQVVSDDDYGYCSYVLEYVTIPNETDRYMMYYQNTLLYNDPPTGMPPYAGYYTGYCNYGAVLNENVSTDWFNTIMECLGSINFDKYTSAQGNISTNTSSIPDIDINDYK